MVYCDSLHSECDIVGYAVVEKYAILRNYTDVSTQGIDVHLFDVDAVDGDMSAVGVVESRQEVGKCCLSGSRWTYDGNLHSSGYCKVDILKNWHTMTVFSVVCETDSLITYRTLEFRHHNGIGFLCYAFIGVHDFEEAFCRCASFLKAAVGFCYAVNWWYQSRK